MWVFVLLTGFSCTLHLMAIGSTTNDVEIMTEVTYTSHLKANDTTIKDVIIVEHFP